MYIAFYNYNTSYSEIRGFFGHCLKLGQGLMTYVFRAPHKRGKNFTGVDDEGHIPTDA